MNRSTPRKNNAQPPSRAGGRLRGESANSSVIPRACGIRRSGLKAHISDSGTIIVRDQADTRLRLTGNQSGSSTISGGTAGQAE